MGQYEKHVFVCTAGKTCFNAGAMEAFDVLKKGVAAAGLKGRVRVNKAGCVNQCGHGPMVVVYPEDIWYGQVDRARAARILSEHIIGGEAVEALAYHAPPGDNKLVDED
ncbi:MAG: (2Fe-2S) ferredoxin domain-containing protein [Gemmatimonadaceae bacterium]